MFRRLASGDQNIRMTKLEENIRLNRLVRAAGLKGPLLSTRANRQYRLLLTKEGDAVHLHGFRYRGDPESYK